MTLLIQIAIAAALFTGISALILRRSKTLAKIISFTILAISGIAAAATGIGALISQHIITYQINSGFPAIIWQFKLDPLAGFFLAIIGIVVTCVAIYAPAYVRDYEKQRPIIGMTFFTGVFISGMYLVVLAADAFSFMLAWELMSISSYFLVVYSHEHGANRRAAFVYLLMAHVSGLLIFLSFGILSKFGTGDFGFAAMQSTSLYLPPIWSSIAFALALAGFGMKSGIIPLHVWLPRAHPVAPSHISALMSGVMLKVAIYGFLRFCFSLLGNTHWQWGVLILCIGAASAIFGILYALMQNNLKKILAYSSVENVGIIFIGIGLSMIFINTGHLLLGALALIAALYHCLNHALFKTLLFLGAGSILQHAHEHDLEKMGGLMRKMPYTSLFFLIGCISISALPPFNGFVSEWLTFQSALQATVLTSEILRIAIPVAAAILALTGALAAACFVRIYGIAFLGQARTRRVKHAKDPRFGMLCSMGILSLLCLVFGILPSVALKFINLIPLYLFSAALPTTSNWLWLIPLSATTASYSAPIILTSLPIIALLLYLSLRIYHKPKNIILAAKQWECGFGGVTPRMQYSAIAFAMPIRRVFKGAWAVSEKIEPNAKKINYSLHIDDWTWKYFYNQLDSGITFIARTFSHLQGGNIRVYLAYAFATLILLLWVIA